MEFLKRWGLIKIPKLYKYLDTGIVLAGLQLEDMVPDS